MMNLLDSHGHFSRNAVSSAEVGMSSYQLRINHAATAFDFVWTGGFFHQGTSVVAFFILVENDDKFLIPSVYLI